VFESFTHLAIDGAPSFTGWALGAPDMREPLAGTFEMPPVGARHGKMLVIAHDWLEKILDAYPIIKVTFETPFLAKGFNLKTKKSTANPEFFGKASKLVGIFEFLCERRGIACTEVPATKWRDHFIQCSQAPRTVPVKKRREWLKERAMQECKERGWFVADHNAAEACGILDYTLSTDFPSYGASSSPLFVKGAAA
jgi:hypothetical protein